ncbi:uncharacterized protein [Acropora muricata]|uniref:uncharacterized protein isoform X1 n=2 Tax=Acropora muricata TaxID=159855 RepID=UPI0034E4765C
MLAYVGLLSVVLTFPVCFSVTCKQSYDRSRYIGKARVPVDCKTESLACSRSWKAGVPEISSDSSNAFDKMVDTKFLYCHEGFTTCGYVPIDARNGKVLGHSGVTIGAGIDLGTKTSTSFVGLSSDIVQKLAPYFGLQKDEAACAIIQNPLRLSREEATKTTNVIKMQILMSVQGRYDQGKKAGAKKFDSLPRGIRTAIVSVWFQFGLPPKYPKFWGHVTTNEWEKAVNELRNFYSNPRDQARGDLRRRNHEADIIEAALSNCTSSVDLVFLLDESGSVGASNFQKSLDFVRRLIGSFPEENLRGENGTRFGLSTFSSSYSAKFHLYNYTNQLGYSSAITRVSYSGGGTQLGFALGRVLTDQFSEERGLRPKADGLPRILVVLTDGESYDNVSTPAKNLTDNEITIYAVGVAFYDLEQLKEIAPSDQHVITLDSFSKLDAFVSTITSSACYEPRASGNNETITTNVEKGSFKYFSYKVSPKKNLEVIVDDLVGSTMLYASRTTPHPYKYDHDYKFERASQKDKVIVIAGNATSPRPKRSTGNNLQPIYIAVTSDTDSAKFAIVANECEPSVCVEGTNERPVINRRSGSSKNYSKFSWVFLLESIAVLLNNYY